MSLPASFPFLHHFPSSIIPFLHHLLLLQQSTGHRLTLATHFFLRCTSLNGIAAIASADFHQALSVPSTVIAFLYPVAFFQLLTMPFPSQKNLGWPVNPSHNQFY
jgi:hypothetical protein